MNKHWINNSAGPLNEQALHKQTLNKQALDEQTCIWIHFFPGEKMKRGKKNETGGKMGRRPGLRAGPGPAQRPPQWSLPKWPQMLIIPRVFLLFVPFRGPQPAPSCPPDPDAQPSNHEIHFFFPAGQKWTQIEPKWL